MAVDLLYKSVLGLVMGTSQFFEARAGSSQTQSGSSRAGLALKGPNFTTIGRDIWTKMKLVYLGTT